LWKLIALGFFGSGGTIDFGKAHGVRVEASCEMCSLLTVEVLLGTDDVVEDVPAVVASD
jgi:hypothetical protein